MGLISWLQNRYFLAQKRADFREKYIVRHDLSDIYDIFTGDILSNKSGFFGGTLEIRDSIFPEDDLEYYKSIIGGISPDILTPKHSYMFTLVNMDTQEIYTGCWLTCWSNQSNILTIRYDAIL